MQEAQAVALVSALTLEEKVALLAGSAAWLSSPVDRLEIPAIKLCDGPNAARGDAIRGVPAACFPVGSALAATWNTPLIQKVGVALGEEAKTKDVQVLLGPTINLHRHPLGGRHFECYSEDPELTGSIACAFINGVQSQGVAACAKHFICNDSEFERHSISSNVDERTLRELYLRPFEMAVNNANLWSIMSAYNRINGVFASSHQSLLRTVLKDEWGFDGAVVSDWGAALETQANMLGGLDLEMPGPARSRGDKLVAAVNAGQVDEALIDDSAARMLRLIARTGRFEEPAHPEQAINQPEHQALARRCAAQSMVLLKNAVPNSKATPLLPLTPQNTATLAVIGPNAAIGQIQGGGSSAVNPHYHVMPLPALESAFESLVYAPGCYNHKYIPMPNTDCLQLLDDNSSGINLRLWDNPSMDGDPVVTRTLSARPSPWGFIPLGVPGRKTTGFAGSDSAKTSVGFSAVLETRFIATEDGLHSLGLLSSDKSRLFLDGAELIDNWSDPQPGDAFFGYGSSERRASLALEAQRSYHLKIEFQSTSSSMLEGVRFGVMHQPSDNPLAAALTAAKSADAVVLVVGSNSDWETEGNDRGNLQLPGDQNALISAVAAVNPNTLVVLNTGAPMAMPWLDEVAAVIQAWLPGQEFGHALVDVITGACDASGRLPTTFPKQLEDCPSNPYYPGENGVVRYEEGIMMGYRGYQQQSVVPLFAFGHGLSYTQWAMSELEVTTQGSGASRSVQVQLQLTNTGDRPGSQVVQLYVSDLTGTVDQPPMALASFHKVDLNPGEQQQISLEVTSAALRYWDASATQPGWRYPPGEYQVHLGTAADNLTLTESLILK
jgi:beta-glucosidase